MMKPRGPGAWWTASLLLGLLAAGLAIAGASPTEPLGWLAILLAIAAIGCAAVAVRGSRRKGSA